MVSFWIIFAFLVFLGGGLLQVKLGLGGDSLSKIDNGNSTTPEEFENNISDDEEEWFCHMHADDEHSG